MYKYHQIYKVHKERLILNINSSVKFENELASSKLGSSIRV